MSADVQITLSEVEQARLHHKERLIERGAQQIGEALRDIRNERLYRETHGTFEAYCEQRWGIGRNYANKQIAAAEVASALGTNVPIREGQARELSPLRDDPDRLREVWQQANEATGGKPTAAAIRAARTPEADLNVNRETGEITDTPPKVTGLDGKEYTRPAPRIAPPKPRRKPFLDDLAGLVQELTTSVQRLTTLLSDARFATNAEQAAAENRDDLIRINGALQGAIEQLTDKEEVTAP